MTRNTRWPARVRVATGVARGHGRSHCVRLARTDEVARGIGHAVPDRARHSDHVRPALLFILDQMRDAAVFVCSDTGVMLAQNDGVFGIRGTALTGPILQVDDVADSRWTITVLGDLLLAAGSGPVYPFTVGKTKQDLPALALAPRGRRMRWRSSQRDHPASVRALPRLISAASVSACCRVHQ